MRCGNFYNYETLSTYWREWKLINIIINRISNPIDFIYLLLTIKKLCGGSVKVCAFEHLSWFRQALAWTNLLLAFHAATMWSKEN